MDARHPCEHCGRPAEPRVEVTVRGNLDAVATGRELQRVLLAIRRRPGHGKA